VIADFQLGLLVAAACTLALLSLLGVGGALALWAWMRSHERGAISWHAQGFEIRADVKKLQSVLSTAQQGGE
jgi:hypothetical protein